MSCIKGLAYASIALLCLNAQTAVASHHKYHHKATSFKDASFKDEGALVAQPMGQFYIGVFGGGGSTNNVSVAQTGTALYAPAAGGPLAVNATGNGNASNGYAGFRVGYQWTGWSMDPSGWRFSPGLEFENYYLFSSTLNASGLNNPTTRLPEHNFNDSFPMDTTVLMANAMFNFKSPWIVTPFLGLGVGAAGMGIHGANSAQISPAEPGINHFNSGKDASSWVFAAQLKTGLSFELMKNLSLSAEYRLLYEASTGVTFGSTQYPTHVPTTNWNVHFGRQLYNMGDIGLTYAI